MHCGLLGANGKLLSRKYLVGENVEWPLFGPVYFVLICRAFSRLVQYLPNHH